MMRRATQRRPFLATLLVLTVLLAPLPAAATHPTARRAAECSPSLPVSEREARELLETERPFSVDDPTLFHSWDHPDWERVPPPESPDGPALTEKQARGALLHLLNKRFPCSPADVRYGLSIYADPVARLKLPDPTLRAALAGLVGTLGEPAIFYLLYEAPVSSIHFGVGFLPEDNGVSLRYAVTWNSFDGTRQIVVDRKYRFSPIGVFSAILFHEALHVSTDDEGSGELEEAIAFSLQALIYMEMLLADPAIAHGSDALTRDLNNHSALLRLNSGPEGSDRMTILVPGSDVNIDPTAVESITQFYDLYNLTGAPASEDFAGRETPGNPLLQHVLDDLAEPGESAPRDAGFDAETLDFLDRNHATLTPAELIAVACILRLDVECD